VRCEILTFDKERPNKNKMVYSVRDIEQKRVLEEEETLERGFLLRPDGELVRFCYVAHGLGTIQDTTRYELVTESEV
jgi:hypothetical protein